MKITKYILIGVSFFICVLLHYTDLSFHSTPLDDCLEFGICAEGLELKNDGKDIIITKDFCKEHNYTWIENASACDTRNRTNKEK